jgi:hypothetical protein
MLPKLLVKAWTPVSVVPFTTVHRPRGLQCKTNENLLNTLKLYWKVNEHKKENDLKQSFSMCLDSLTFTLLNLEEHN